MPFINHWLEKIIKKEENKKVDKQWLFLIIIAAVFLIVLILSVPVLAFEIKYRDKFFPGARIGNLNFEGLTPNEALALIEQTTDKIEREGIKIIYQNNGDSFLKIMPVINAISDPDLSREILSFNNQKTARELFQLGRNDVWRRNLAVQIKMLLRPAQFNASFTLNEAALREFLKSQLAGLANPAQNAQPQIDWQDARYQIAIVEERVGTIADLDQVINELKNNLKNLNNNTIQLNQIIDQPTIKKAEAETKQYLIEEVLATTTLTLTWEKNSWLISPKELAPMLEFQKRESEITLGINQEFFKDWLEKNIALAVNIEPRDASVEFKDGKITKFIAHREGRKIDLAKIYELINKSLLSENKKFEIIVDIVPPQITTEEVNNLGIKEIIGTGASNFGGSPKNRRHNIRNGANKLDGILIKPGEEFSLVKALGDVDATTGYLPELVIKENKTTPEFGGGLCQIGTTIFRAAMAAGLPITERRSHSYSVTYYLEDGLPGTDATIYIPHPDVRFINDTGYYVLIQSRIEGDNLYFDFWGTNDGRQVERTKPKVWGWTSPPATKYIETLELKPGEKKCTEKSHKGVNTSFDYNVTYPNGEVKKTTFTSHYKPWQAVCLIGVEKLSEDQTATSTESIPINL